jgi:hypothetical protein
LLTLGIPPNAVMALMVGAMTIHNIQPGPQVMTSNPALFWGLIASMWIGNVMLILLNLPLIGIWVKLLKIPYRFLYPAILVFCCIGVYTVNNTVFDVYVTAGFGLIGYLFFKLGCEPPPLLFGLCSWTYDGRELPSRIVTLSRRLHNLRYSSTVTRTIDCSRFTGSNRSPARSEKDSRRGLRRRLIFSTSQKRARSSLRAFSL